MKVVEVSNLITKFGDRTIHDSISFDVKKGEIFSIIGSSGSGKSTLLKELTMLLPFDYGKVIIFGEDISELNSAQKKEFLKNLGVLFQGSALFSSLTIEENISILFKEYSRLSSHTVRDIAYYKLSLVGLEPFVGGLYPSELSGGMKKRAALARALALDPKLLFLDEPTSGLDPVSSREFDSLILSLKNTLDATFIMVSHDARSVRDTSDKIMALDSADIVFLGDAASALNNEHPFLKSFFDTL